MFEFSRFGLIFQLDNCSANKLSLNIFYFQCLFICQKAQHPRSVNIFDGRAESMLSAPGAMSHIFRPTGLEGRNLRPRNTNPASFPRRFLEFASRSRTCRGHLVLSASRSRNPRMIASRAQTTRQTLEKNRLVKNLQS